MLLVCSPGGHLQQMLALEPVWFDARRVWVTLPSPDAEYLLRDEQVVWAHGPTNRSVAKLVENFVLALSVVRRVGPDVVLSTGAALAVPFLAVAKLHGHRAVYVESFTREGGLSLTGRIVYSYADDFFVQWQELADRFPRATYVGSVL
jgi:beta-1,4-N-acetylglucosaminyltransferase